MESFFANNPSASVSSDRILYTPSDFAKSALLHLQEIGTLRALKKHTSKRDFLNSFLFILVLRGKGSLTCGGESHELKEGDCAFIDCRKPYSHTTSEELWTIRWCHFYGPTMAAVYEKYTERGGKAVFTPSDTVRFIEVLDRIAVVAKGDDYIRDMKINEELNGLCTLLMGESWHPEAAAVRSVKRQSVLEVKEYLEQHYMEKISLEQLSKDFYINKYYLARMFKEQFGMSVISYLVNIRITHAKQMLRFTDKSVEEIGAECGMGALHYFSRVFKEVEGVPPSTYRAQW